MSNYSLNINFDSESLKLMNDNGSRLTIVKQPSQVHSSANVVWMTFNPLEKNTISWKEDYSAYLPATSTVAEVSAVESFNKEQPSSADAPVNYLSGDVVVNGEIIRGTPSFEASVQDNQVESITEDNEGIVVYLLVGTDNESGIIQDGQAIKITLDQNSADLTIKYDPAAGRFVSID